MHVHQMSIAKAEIDDKKYTKILDKKREDILQM